MKHYYDFTIADFSFLNLPPTYGIFYLTKQAAENPEYRAIFNDLLTTGLTVHAEIDSTYEVLFYIAWHPALMETPPNTHLPQYKIDFAQRKFRLDASFAPYQ